MPRGTPSSTAHSKPLPYTEVGEASHKRLLHLANLYGLTPQMFLRTFVENWLIVAPDPTGLTSVTQIALAPPILLSHILAEDLAKHGTPAGPASQADDALPTCPREPSLVAHLVTRAFVRKTAKRIQENALVQYNQIPQDQDRRRL